MLFTTRTKAQEKKRSPPAFFPLYQTPNRTDKIKPPDIRTALQASGKDVSMMKASVLVTGVSLMVTVELSSYG